MTRRINIDPRLLLFLHRGEVAVTGPYSRPHQSYFPPIDRAATIVIMIEHGIRCRHSEFSALFLAGAERDQGIIGRRKDRLPIDTDDFSEDSWP